MSFLLYGDTHYNEWPTLSKPLPSGINSRFQDQLNVSRQIARYVEMKRPDTVIHGGDFTHRRYFVSFSTLNPSIQVTDEIIAPAKKMYILRGNHDMEDKEGFYSSVGVLRGRPKVTVVDSPIAARLDGDTLGWLVPYMTGERCVEALQRPPDQGMTAVAHYAADDKVLESDFRLPSPLSKASLDPYRHVFFHHVHHPSAEGKINYVGAPMHQDFGDILDRFCLFVDGDKLEWLPLTGPRFVTVKWPRVSPPPDEGGFVRILDVPVDSLLEAKKIALELGWSDVITLKADDMPAEVFQLVRKSMDVDEEVIGTYLQARFGHLWSVAEVARLQEKIMRYVSMARGQ